MSSTTSSLNMRTLQDYDKLSVYDKARLLQSLPSFKQSNQKLPRPRTVLEQQSDSDNKDIPVLDRLLLPFVDEFIRRDYNIRLAERNGDMSLANRLKEEKTKRHLLFESMYNSGFPAFSQEQ